MDELRKSFASLCNNKTSENEYMNKMLAEEKEKREKADNKVEELMMKIQEAEILQHFLQKEIQIRENEVRVHCCF